MVTTSLHMVAVILFMFCNPCFSQCDCSLCFLNFLSVQKIPAELQIFCTDRKLRINLPLGPLWIWEQLDKAFMFIYKSSSKKEFPDHYSKYSANYSKPWSLGRASHKNKTRFILNEQAETREQKEKRSKDMFLKTNVSQIKYARLL